MPKPKISAKELIADIRAGMDDPALMKKYGLSAQGLQSAFKKLVEAKAVKQSELDNRVPLAERTVDIVWKCPACGKPQTQQADICPNCGVIEAKFKASQGQQPETSKNPANGDRNRRYSSRSNSQKIVWILTGVAAFIIIVLVFFLTKHTTVQPQQSTEGQIKRSVQAQKELDRIYEPMKRQISRLDKQLSTGVTYQEYRQMCNDFAGALGELETALRGRGPELIEVLNEVNESLAAASKWWRLEMDGDAWLYGQKRKEDWKKAMEQLQEASEIMQAGAQPVTSTP
ncbi:MAG: hypothetical protein ACLQPD_29235 [Desulfomonilaceae bacterium]